MFLKFRSISFLDYFIHTTNLMCVTRIFFSPILPFIICRYHYFHSYQKNYIKKKNSPPILEMPNICSMESIFFDRLQRCRQFECMYTFRIHTYTSLYPVRKKLRRGYWHMRGESFLVIVLIQEHFFFLFIMTFRWVETLIWSDGILGRGRHLGMA